MDDETLNPGMKNYLAQFSSGDTGTAGCKHELTQKHTYVQEQIDELLTHCHINHNNLKQC